MQVHVQLCMSRDVWVINQWVQWHCAVTIFFILFFLLYHDWCWCLKSSTLCMHITTASLHPIFCNELDSDLGHILTSLIRVMFLIEWWTRRRCDVYDTALRESGCSIPAATKTVCYRLYIRPTDLIPGTVGTGSPGAWPGQREWLEFAGLENYGLENDGVEQEQTYMHSCLLLTYVLSLGVNVVEHTVAPISSNNTLWLWMHTCALLDLAQWCVRHIAVPTRYTAKPTRRKFRRRRRRWRRAVDTDCCQRVGRSVGARSASCCRHTITVLWSMFVGTDRRLCHGTLRTRKILRELFASRSGRGWW